MSLSIRRPEPGCAGCCDGNINKWGDEGGGGISAGMSAAAAAAFTARRGGDDDDGDAAGSNDDMAAIAKEMNELSVQEREQVLEELHGVAEQHEETPEFVSSRLQLLDKCLSELPKVSRKALDRALFFRPSIADDKKFLLMFLRAATYDPYQAARRIAKYYEDKLMLFGEKRLAKDITLDDFDEVDRKVFDMGTCLVLPDKDNSGRPIWFFDMRTFDLNYITSMIRCSWYQVMATLEDDEEAAQMKGVCDVAYCPKDLFQTPAALAGVLELGKLAGDVLPNLPARITSYHFCYNDPKMRAILSMIRMAFGKQVRLRNRTHYGSDLEMRYSLLSFGIHLTKLLGEAPEISQKRHQELHKQYTSRRIEKERKRLKEEELETQRTGIVLYPNPNDVLVGRGRSYREFSGNLQWSQIIDSRLRSYRECDDKFGKTCISMDVVRTVREYGGRFLLPEHPKGWKVINDISAREKTSSLFRSKAAKVAAELNNVSGGIGSNGKGGGIGGGSSTGIANGHSMLAMLSLERTGFSSPEGAGSSKRLRYDPNAYQMANNTTPGGGGGIAIL